MDRPDSARAGSLGAITPCDRLVFAYNASSGPAFTAWMTQEDVVGRDDVSGLTFVVFTADFRLEGDRFNKTKFPLIVDLSAEQPVFYAQENDWSTWHTNLQKFPAKRMVIGTFDEFHPD